MGCLSSLFQFERSSKGKAHTKQKSIGIIHNLNLTEAFNELYNVDHISGQQVALHGRITNSIKKYNEKNVFCEKQLMLSIKIYSKEALINEKKKRFIQTISLKFSKAFSLLNKCLYCLLSLKYKFYFLISVFVFTLNRSYFSKCNCVHR